MKFFAALALLIAAGVTAQDPNCEAEYIVDRCLKTETAKIDACKTDPNNSACLCAAYQAVATCYNNCPNDTRGPPARQQVTAFCSNVTTTSAPTVLATAAPSSSSSNANGVATNLNPSPPTNTGFVASATPTGGHSAGVINQVGSFALFAGVAGALAAIL